MTTESVTRVCAADDCAEEFTPKRSNQIYHTPSCGQRQYNRSRAQQPALENQALEGALAAAHQKDIERVNREELKRVTALESRMRRYEKVLRKSLEAYDPTPLVIQPPAPQLELPKHDAILVTGDWHTGMRAKIHETGGVYEQDVAMTRSQVYMLWDRVQRLHQIQSAGIDFQRLHIISLGDLVDGDDMRPVQHRQVEDIVTVQTIQAFELFTWLVRQALTIFPEVEVDMVGGNHDRTSRKAGNAGLGELDYADTFSWLIGEFTKRAFEHEPRVKVRNWNTFFGYKEVAGQRVVFEHGSSIKWAANSYGGVPWYGVSQLPRRYGDMLGRGDILLMGHGHRPAVLPDGRGWLIVNGALPATSNYEQSSFKSVHRPLQWLLSVHRKYGLTGWLPIYLDVPGTVLPGEIWTDPESYASRANDRV